MGERHARAVRVVEVEDAGLRPDVRGAVRVGVQRVAVELGRTAFVGRDHQGHRALTPWHRRGIEQRFARDHPFDVLGVGNQLRLRFAAARAAQPGQRRGRPHEAHELAAVKAGGAFRELAFDPAPGFGRAGQAGGAAPRLAGGGAGPGLVRGGLHAGNGSGIRRMEVGRGAAAASGGRCRTSREGSPSSWRPADPPTVAG